MKKLLFMTDPAVIDSDLKPLWQARHLACHIFSGALQSSEMQMPFRDMELMWMCYRVVYLSAS